MRKSIFIILSLITIFLLTGCGKVNLDLGKVKTSIEELQDEKIDVSLVYGEVNMNEKYQELEYVYNESDYKKFGFNMSDLEEYSFAYNKENKDFYIVFKTKTNKEKDVKNSIEAFVNKLKTNETNDEIRNKLDNYELKEKDGCIIAVAVSDNEELLKIIESCKNPIFANVMDVPVESIEDILEIKQDQVEEFLMGIPMMVVKSNTYIIVKPSEGNKTVVKEKIEQYLTNLEKQWETYLPDQYELVKNRLEKELGDYLIYVVSIDNDLVYETIKECKK